MSNAAVRMARVKQEISRLQMRDAILRHAIRKRLHDKLRAPRNLAIAFGVGAVTAAVTASTQDDAQPRVRHDRLLGALGWVAELSGLVVTLRTAYRALRGQA